jgi:hypothetical protein
MVGMALSRQVDSHCGVSTTLGEIFGLAAELVQASNLANNESIILLSLLETASSLP